MTAYPQPRRLRSALPLWAFGLEGPWLARHLTASLEAAAARDQALAKTAVALAAWNFERTPLDPAFAASAREAARAAGDSPRRRAFCAALSRRLRLPRDASAWPALRDGADIEAALLVVRAGLADPVHGLFWQGRAFAFALARNLPGLARGVIESLADDPSLAPVATRLAAEAAFAWDGPAAGMAALDGVDAELFPRFCALARAHGLAETGQPDAATSILRRLWRAENWHPGLTLRLHALLTRPPARAVLDALPGRLLVFLYSWNRAKLLATTLDSLAASRLGPARIVVLDNGGTDDTGAVCREASARLGPDRFSTIRLPVNVGAPAARNWLAAASGLGPDDLAAYVDDDVTLPEHWLETLATALLADPVADVAGARIVSAGGSGGVQAADVRLLPPDGANTVRPLVNYGPGPDFGLLATVRPCPSVSGCCHLLRGSALGGPAPFDIRFSPSQFDDLARDLRGYLLAGRRAVYTGTLAVSHHQHAGPAQARSPAAVGQLLGARAKLDGLFTRSEMEVAAVRDTDTAWEELEAKWRELRETA